MKSQSPTKRASCYVNSDKLKIIIRMRPILPEQDSDQFVQVTDDNTLQIKRPNNIAYMKFNNILPSDSTQKDVFVLLQDSIKDFINGINVTIFAYGQTGAGKTYSIIGLYSPQDSYQNLFNFLSSRQRGILSRSLQTIMSFTLKHKQYKISVSFYQIYNEKIFDLYNHTMNPLQIRQSKSGEITIPELITLQINNMQQAIKFLMIGLKNRSTRSTHGNIQSSRSHSVFQINLTKYQNNKQIINSTLKIVDLAGSQKFKIPHDLSVSQKQIRVQQLTSINGSLSCLGHCISVMIQKQRTHIPFRNSKLTRILSDSLLGKGKMRFIICISPSLTTEAQTFSTLQFANRAKKALLLRQNTPTRIKTQYTNTHNQQIVNLTKQLNKQKQKIKQLQNQFWKIPNINVCSQKIKQNMILIKQNQQLQIQINKFKCQKQNQHIINKLSQNSINGTKRVNINETKRTNQINQQNKNKSKNKFNLQINTTQQQNQNYDVLHQKQQQLSVNFSFFKLPTNNLPQKQSNCNIKQFQKRVKKFLQQNSPLKQQKCSKQKSLNLKQSKLALHNNFFDNNNHNKNCNAKSTSHNNSIYSQKNSINKSSQLQNTKRHQTNNNSSANTSLNKLYKLCQKQNRKQAQKYWNLFKCKKNRKSLHNITRTSNQSNLQNITKRHATNYIDKSDDQSTFPKFQEKPIYKQYFN